MPRLETHRLVLRPPEYSDAPRMAALLSAFDVTKSLSSAPHPYALDDARAFVSRTAAMRARGEGFVFSILYKEDESLLGTCGLNLKNGVFELGYWIGKPYWGMGIATEAAGKVVSFAFNSLKAAELSAGWFQDNPASGRVLTKLGFAPTGTEWYPCRARNGVFACNRMQLTRQEFGRRMAA